MGGAVVARYKPYEVKQDKFIPLSFADQVVPGSFEYALNEIVDLFSDVLLCCDQLGLIGKGP